MWCVGVLDAQYRERMYGLLDLYARAFRRDQPVICVDEKCTQLLAHSRAPLPMMCGAPVREDYEYVRRDACNLFMTVEPGAGRRAVAFTEHRGKTDFVAFARHLIDHVYRSASCIHLVLDNLNIHMRKNFYDVLGKSAASRHLKRVRFHYTPKHANWLNMAEIEIGVLTRQCLDRCCAERGVMASEVAAWRRQRNRERTPIRWTFTRQDVDRKLGHHHVAQNSVSSYQLDLRLRPQDARLNLLNPLIPKHSQICAMERRGACGIRQWGVPFTRPGASSSAGSRQCAPGSPSRPTSISLLRWPRCALISVFVLTL